MTTMDTFLFAWNPKRYDWDDLEDNIKQVYETGKASVRWSCGNTKSIQTGDRIFLVKLGTEPKGIIGEGIATTIPIYGTHWSEENQQSLYIGIDFEVLLNPEEELILTLDSLQANELTKRYNWTPQASGIKIKPEVAVALEEIWFKFLATQEIRYNPFTMQQNKSEKIYTEGTPNQIMLTRYERNPFARKSCLQHHGYSCAVCDFNFELFYGDIGKNFIHVHHLYQVAKIGKQHAVDPIHDLIPICPNCHSMIHKQKEILSIEKLKSCIKD